MTSSRDHDGTQPGINGNYPKEWEQRSAQVLGVIRCFVDGLRSAPNLKVWSQSTTIEDDMVAGSLLLHLHSIGVIRQVQELHQLPGNPYPLKHPTLKNFPDTSLGSLLRQQYEADERKQILHHAIYPLLCHLEQCYCILDSLDNLPQTHTEGSHSKIQSQTSATKSRRKTTAPPPIGMLSLNDYTNVACLLEFTVSISLIPLLEYPGIYLPPLATRSNVNHLFTDVHIHKIDKHTTFTAQKRNQALPKSLAGRISKTVLTWGTVCAAINHDALFEKLLMLRAQPLHASQNDSKDMCDIHQLHHIHRIFHAYNEMTILASTVGRVLLLDRFRPMLLPRHLSDVYLSLLIAERLRWYLSKADNNIPCETEDFMLAKLIETEKTAEMWNSERLRVLEKTLLMFPLEFPSSLISATPNPSPQKMVDCREAALAYRSLLSGGASMIISGASNLIPAWLRLRLGQCLSKLAQEDLQSVVDVFVAYACGPGGGDNNAIANMNNDVMTGASARLACALCAKAMTAHNSSSSERKFIAFKEQLCTQFVDFLVAEGEAYTVGRKSNSLYDPAQSRSTVAMHLTLWATFAQLPVENLHSFFVARLMSGLSPGKQVNSQESSSYQLTAMQSMAAIVTWLCTIPSTLDLPSTKKMQSLLLESCMPSNGHHLTIVGQTLRLAASFSRGNLIVEIDRKEVGDDEVLAGLVEKALAKMVEILGNMPSCHVQSTSVALELLKTVSANNFDKEGYCFEESEPEPKDQDKISPCSSKVYRINFGASSGNDLPQIIWGIECRVKCLVGTMSTLSEMNDDMCNMNELSSAMFRLALILHYSSTATDHSVVHTMGLGELSKIGGCELKMAASIALGTLLENFPPSSLLGSDFGDLESDTSVLAILGLLINSAAARMENVQEKSAEEEESELFSSVSIVLNLLITLLELGKEQRSMSDETFFKSILPSLQVIASGKMEDGSMGIRMVPELAEMASHAMALIVARGEIAITDDTQTSLVAVANTMTRLDTILTKLSQAECDLQSCHPPLRARGVVSLRHLAHALVNNEKGCIGVRSSDLVKRKAVISEINEPTSVPANKLSLNDELPLLSRTLAKICLSALADPESYVYLASIQTLVSICDACPSEVLPLMGEVIARGQLDISVANVDANVAFVKLCCTPEQRIKAIEALIFIIRRRGDGIFIYGPRLVDTLLFGTRMDQNLRKPKLGNDGKTAHLIQRQTHLYFIGAASEAVDDGADEKKVRLNTGGPIFSMEETDVLRAGAISVVCELISMLNPITVASYCHVLVRLATDALQLDASRPVRRIAACLARDLYGCVMREATSPSGVNTDYTSSMAVAIVDADEENLYNVLKSCVSADELGTITKSSLVDPATQCRSQEAIDIRLDLEAMGVLQAAAMIVFSLKMELNNPVIQGVRRALSRNSA